MAAGWRALWLCSLAAGVSLLPEAGRAAKDDGRWFFHDQVDEQRVAPTAAPQALARPARASPGLAADLHPLTIRRSHAREDHHQRAWVERRHVRPVTVARLPAGPADVPVPEAKPDDLSQPEPPPTPMQRILRDATLRPGDMVMMAQGLKVFTGEPRQQHTAADFVALDQYKSIDKRFRAGLIQISMTYDHPGW